MGGWKLEVGKMALYLTFPVLAFHLFNQPALWEKWIVQTKREYFPPEDPEQKRLIEQTKSDLRKRRNEELLALLKESQNKQ